MKVRGRPPSRSLLLMSNTRDKKQLTEVAGFSESELLVPSWEGQRVGEAWVYDYHNPFQKKFESLKSRPEFVGPFVDVHDDLEICRSIAVSIYGRAWAEHLMDVYDRVQAERVRKKSDEES